MSPRFLIDMLSGTGVHNFKDAHSFTRLFELMVEDQNIEVQYNFEVTVNDIICNDFNANLSNSQLSRTSGRSMMVLINCVIKMATQKNLTS